MYEELEAWNAEMEKTIDWIEENKLQSKIAKEFSLPVDTTEDVFFDDDGNGYIIKELNKLAKRL